MEELKKMYNEANEMLYKKGYCVCNMVEPYNNEYELYNCDMKVVIDHLSLAQLSDLAKLL